MTSETGKRYTCGTCGGQVIVTAGGQGDLTCCDEPMTA